MKTPCVSMSHSKSSWTQGNNAHTRLKEAVEECLLKGAVGLVLFRRPYGELLQNKATWSCRTQTGYVNATSLCIHIFLDMQIPANIVSAIFQFRLLKENPATSLSFIKLVIPQQKLCLIRRQTDLPLGLMTLMMFCKMLWEQTVW